MKLRENAILVNKNKEIMLLYGSAFLFLLIAPLFIKNAFVIRLMTTTLAIVRNWNSVTNGATGISAIPRPVIFGKKISSGMDFYYLTFIVMVIAFSLLNNVIHSKIGRNLQGIRDNELGAISVGVKAKRLKLFAFTVGTFFAGVAGCLYAFYISAINPNNFVFNISTQIMQMCILGGLGSLPGAVIGAAYVSKPSCF